VVVAVPLGGGTALSRISGSNRVIAISVPNVTNGLSSSWQTYVTSPLSIEQATGFRFFTALPGGVAETFRLKIDVRASVPVVTATLVANQLFGFTVTGSPGSNYVVQATTNLAAGNWITVQTNRAPFVFTETSLAAFRQRFYRAAPAP
jgi:hypothetical protein